MYKFRRDGEPVPYGEVGSLQTPLAFSFKERWPSDREVGEVVEGCVSSVILSEAKNLWFCPFSAKEIPSNGGTK